jgi:TRAP-type C4-dicarboxylate transport system substrate-binding protein
MSYYERNKNIIKERNLNYYYQNKIINKQKFESLPEKEKQDIFNKGSYINATIG